MHVESHRRKGLLKRAEATFAVILYFEILPRKPGNRTAEIQPKKIWKPCLPWTNLLPGSGLFDRYKCLRLHAEEGDAMAKSVPAVRNPWWKGARGEWFVVVQVLLMGLVFFGPRTLGALPAWISPFPQAYPVAGALLMVLGGILFLAGIVCLGRGLTPLPYPKKQAKLIDKGPFALVRHPIYSGGLVLCLGWALSMQGWLTLGYVCALFVLLDVKARREEKWLVARFPAYATYQQRVRKLIPFIY